MSQIELLAKEREANDLKGELDSANVTIPRLEAAVAEARKLGIPVIGVVDTNHSPEGISYVIPGNDDAARAIAMYCDLVARAALDGMTAQMGAAGIDLGALEAAPEEEAVAEA